eukprot:TRINITY_DN4646_c0_g1_i1.p1 TRINITY_DN4646_c0_g1~~TRINITY_DN4646_c0_g1_i1.p1  ORF type:complete len:430 (+),score=80.09 TRINITY_DN4646_c0_g1_i1:16-1305(+)
MISRILSCCALGFGAVLAIPRQSVAASETAHDDGIVQDKDGRYLRLKQVQVFFRHGARTPIHHIPGEHNKEASWNISMCQELKDEERALRITNTEGGPRPISMLNEKQKLRLLPGGCHIGCLTTQGRGDVLVLGQRLRQRYVDELGFLDSRYNPEDVEVRSTNIERTIESARMVLSGLFGASGMHINVQTVPDEQEYLYPNAKACPKLKQLFKEARAEARKNIPDERTQFVKKMAKLLNVVDDDIQFVGLRDNLIARRAHNKPIPEGLHINALRQIDQYATNEVLMLFRKDPEATLRLTCGLVLKDVLDMMKGAITTPLTTPKIKLYSAHDTTVMPLLLVLGCFDGRWPPFAADITLELYEDVNHPDKNYVRALYCGKPVTLPKAESEYHDYDAFEKSLSKLIPQDYQQACQIDQVLKANVRDQDGTTF